MQMRFVVKPHEMMQYEEEGEEEEKLVPIKGEAS